MQERSFDMNAERSKADAALGWLFAANLRTLRASADSFRLPPVKAITLTVSAVRRLPG